MLSSQPSLMLRIKYSVLSIILLFLAPNLVAQQLSDYSVLPENLNSSPSLTPSVLFILDSSGSMHFDSSGRIAAGDQGANHPNSRSHAVRGVLRNLFRDNVDEINIGLMTFGGKPNFWSGPHNIINCGGYASCPGGRATLYYRNTTGRGVLLSNISPLDEKKLNQMNGFGSTPGVISTEPRRPRLQGNRRFGTLTYHPNPNSIYYNNILLSSWGTPLTGTLQSAYRYLISRSLPQDEIEILGNQPVVYPNTNLGQCAGKTYVFLVTDGDPTINNQGGGVSISTEVPRTASAAAALRRAGVDVFVFGFQVGGSSARNMNTISQSGSGQNAFISNNASTLQKQLEEALGSIKSPIGSSSGISVVENSTQAAGSIVQANYLASVEAPKNSTASNKEVHWTGRLNAYFIDRYGYLREDAGIKGQLEGYNTDNAFILELFDDPNQDLEEVRATRLNVTGVGTPSFSETVTQRGIPLDQLNTLWSAERLLSEPYQSVTGNNRLTVANQFGSVNRKYNRVASNSNGYRRIYSWIQSDLSDPGNDNGKQYDDGTQIELIYDNSSTTSDTINNSNYTLLGVTSPIEAQKIIRFIRGQEDLPDTRSRSIGDKVYLLGDIIRSSAVQIDSPDNTPFTRFENSDYKEYKSAYKDRRRMTYIGGNDGLLHAFNGGFWDEKNKRFNLTSPSDNVAHKLGAEMWAYAPMNLLPHLQWLTLEDYTDSVHVAYMDGQVRAFDVQAFNPNDTTNGHIKGWGTIIVAGMRLGGGDFPNVDPDANPSNNNNFTTRSAYVVMDVTDPSKEPRVIAEITHKDLNFTTGTPEVMKDGDDWYLVFGSGPNDLETATTVNKPGEANTPSFFRYKLNYNDRGFVMQGNSSRLQAGNKIGFIGNPIATDWDNDGTDDAVYFGTVSGTTSNTDGALYRYINQGTQAGKIKLLLDAKRAVFDKPFLKTFEEKNWVFFGTGRYLSESDEVNSQQNTFYGLIEDTGTYSSLQVSSVLDVSNVKVSTSGTLSPALGSISSFDDLYTEILTNDLVNGWKNNYFNANPSVKNASSPFNFDSLLFYTYYEPAEQNPNECEPDPLGTSFIDVVDLVTGVASYFPDFEGPLGSTGGTINKSATVGAGYAYQSYLFIGLDRKGDGNAGLVKTPLGTGVITDTKINLPPVRNGGEGRTSWREIDEQ